MTRIFLTFLVVIFYSSAGAQTTVVETFAGGEKNQINALDASFADIKGITSDDEGNIYIAEFDNNRIMKYSLAGTVSVYAGTGTMWAGEREDGHPATETFIQGPSDVAIDPDGNLVFSERLSGLIRRVNRDGTITTLAGRFDGTINTGTNVASEVSVTYPAGIDVDKDGSIYVAETGSHIIRRISPDGSTLVVAGSAHSSGFSGDGDIAIFAKLNSPTDVKVHESGEIFVVDYLNNRLRRINTAGVITTIAGTGNYPSSGDGGPAIEAGFSDLKSVSMDHEGNVYLADDTSIRTIDNNGQITHYVGITNRLNDITFLTDGTPILAESGKLLKVNTNQTIQIIAGSGFTFYSGDEIPADDAQLNFPIDVHADQMGNLFISDDGNKRIRKVTADGIIRTIVGNGIPHYTGDGGNAIDASITRAMDMVTDTEGNLYFLDQGFRVRKIDTDGKIYTVAGNGEYGYSGDGGPATSAQINAGALTVDSNGNLYISCWRYIRRVDKNGIITTFAGSDQYGSAGDGGPAIDALFGQINSISFDAEGNLYLMDKAFREIRKIGTDGIVQTIAGGGGALGEDIPALGAAFGDPGDMAVDADGNIYFTEYDKHRIRKIDQEGVITTFAGPHYQNFFGFNDTDSPADARFARPRGITTGPDGSVYVADEYNHRIRRIGEKTIVGLEEALPESSRIQSFPNPFTTSFQLQTDLAGEAELQMINLEGKIVFSAIINLGEELSCSPDIPPGVYILRVKATTSTEAVRIIKISQ